MAHFEIVRTDAGHHVRLEGDNHEAVWTTEVYGTEYDARDAIFFLCRSLLPTTYADLDAGYLTLSLDNDPLGQKLAIPVAHVDKRSEK